MASFIKQFFDKLGNEVFPKTREKAIYDDNNVRLDNKLDSFVTKTNGIQVFTDLPTGTDLHTVPNGYYKLLSNNYINYPPEMNQYGGTYLKASVGGFLHGIVIDIVGDMFIFIVNGGGWQKVLKKSDIIQSDTVGGTDKVPSAEITKSLGLEIDNVNNNLIKYHTVQSVVTLEANTDTVVYNVSIDPFFTGKTIVGALPLVYDGWADTKFISSMRYDPDNKWVMGRTSVHQQYTISMAILYI